MQPTVSLGDLTVDHFQNHHDSQFQLTGPDGSHHALTLMTVTPLPSNRPAPRQPFSLIFSGTPGVVLSQQIYPLAHPDFGTLEIFLVPIASTAAGTEYQAIFA